MSPQVIMDGLIAGSMIGLGAIGVTLTYSILRFANFAHGEFIAWGAYATLLGAGLVGFLAGREIPPLGPFSFGWPVLFAGALAMVVTGLMALALDLVLFKRLRVRGNAIIMVMASFGASLALRALLEFIFTGEPRYFSRDIQIDGHLLPKGSYSIWTIPRPDSWTVIFNNAANAYHTEYPGEAQDALRLDVHPEQGPHVETLTFSFPVVEGKDAVLRLEWGELRLPLSIRVP